MDIIWSAQFVPLSTSYNFARFCKVAVDSIYETNEELRSHLLIHAYRHVSIQISF